MSDRPKFVPRASKRDICVEAGRRGGLKRGRYTLPRVTRSMGDTFTIDTEGEDRIRREGIRILKRMGIPLKDKP